MAFLSDEEPVFSDGPLTKCTPWSIDSALYGGVDCKRYCNGFRRDSLCARDPVLDEHTK